MPEFTLTNAVSVVVPTRGRPHLLQRAIDSIIGQTHSNFEIIVVVDGPDVMTRQAVAAGTDSRVRMIALDTSVGGSEARNIGVREARYPWIAFLDDDDEWLPTKLERQMRAARSSTAAMPVVVGSLIARTARGDYVWPRRLPRGNTPIGNYLFERHSFFRGEAQLQTSLILAPRALMLRVPFRPDRKKHQDTQWYIDADRQPDVRFEFVADPLAIWNVEEGTRQTVSRATDWRGTLTWINGNRGYVGDRAYGDYLLTQVAAEASRSGDWSAICPLLRLAITRGRPGPIAYLLFVAMWIVPPKARHSIRHSLSRVRSYAAPAAATHEGAAL